MSAHKRIDAVCICITVITLAMTVLFMNGEKLDDQRAEGNFTFDDEGYPQMVSEHTREKAPRQLNFDGVSGDIYLTAGK